MGNPSILRSRNFLLFLSGQFISRLGDSMNTLALVWMMHVLTNSAFMISLLLIATMLPGIFIQPVTGALVDRWRKRRTMMLTDIGRGVLVLGLAVLTMSDHASPWMLIAMAFVLSTLTTMFSPAFTVMQKEMVQNESLLQARSFQQISTNISQIAGPALAGIIVGFAGLSVAFYANASTFAVSFLSLLLIRHTEAAPEKQKLSVQALFHDISDGARVLRANRQLRLLTPFMLAYSFAIAGLENLLLVQFVANTLHGGAFEVGIMNGCLAAGELVSSLMLTVSKRNWNTARNLFINIVITSLSIGMMGFFHHYWTTGAAMFVAGFCMTIVNLSFFTGIQQTVPTDSLGRVWALLGAVFQGIVPPSQLVYGALAVFLPAGQLISVSGFVGAAIGLVALLNPTLRSADQDVASLTTEEPTEGVGS